MPPIDVILLTGTSSSGKTSIAIALQQILPEPFLHMQLDEFIKMMPRHDHDQFCSMVSGFHRCIAAMVSAQNRVVVDHVLLLPEWLEECRIVLADYSVILVGVHCPLDELERRERLRDAGRQGFARSQYDKVHKGRTYDLVVHTDIFTPDQCAHQILEFYQTGRPSSLSGRMC